MHRSQLRLLVVAVIANVCLWVEYSAMHPRGGDFGAIHNNGIRVYMLTAAGIAYLCNIVYIGLVTMSHMKRGLPEHVNTVTTATAVYFVLQLAFLPLVRASLGGSIGKIWVRILLSCCIVPLAIMSIIAVQSRNVTLIILSMIPLLHATVNDAALYGGLF